MIIVHKLNNQKIVINDAQIECIEVIPESKIVMMNGRFHVVKESPEEIIQKTIEYNGAISSFAENKAEIAE
ncbi:MAG: flagellar FlbD family protein [Lachnospiraceae bacterium]|jgi:flagellar protein FlbD|nr:flagellar FlbD family protein [Lachnospiraceae bacterium]